MVNGGEIVFLLSHLQKSEKGEDATEPLATTRLYYCHCEARSAEAISPEERFASGSPGFLIKMDFAQIFTKRPFHFMRQATEAASGSPDLHRNP